MSGGLGGQAGVIWGPVGSPRDHMLPAILLPGSTRLGVRGG